jgi:hypothetical protein
MIDIGSGELELSLKHIICKITVSFFHSYERMLRECGEQNLKNLLVLCSVYIAFMKYYV